MAERVEERLARIESNLDNAKIEMGDLKDLTNHILNKVLGLCVQVGEIVVGFNDYRKQQVELNYNRRLGKCEDHVKLVKNLVKIGCWALSIAIPIVGVIIALVKMNGGG